MSVAAAQVTRTVVRPLRAVLISTDGTHRITLTIVVADRLPKIVMLNGEPFLIEEDPDPARPFYFQERPFRADIGE